MAFRQIKSPALANAAVIESKLDATSVSGQTGASSVNSADTFLLHVNATSSLKKVTASDLIGSYTTADLAEDSSALYFTPALAQAAVAADIAAAVLVETNRATTAEGVNTTAITNEAATARAAEAANTTAISNEETRALAAESALDTAYKAADTALQTQITNIISNVDPASLDSLSEIVTAFQSADTVFTAGIAANATAITNEVARATGVEGTNATAIATETSRAQGVEATNAAAVVTEATARVAADNALDARVTANEGDITTLTSGLAAEISATNGDISTLTSGLAAEITRATGSEAANASDIAAEETARQNADTSIRTDFAAADVTTLASAATYTDTAEADAIASAATDATTKANAAVVTANAYTDTRETAITTAYETYADQAEADAETAAATYTDAEVLTEKTRALAAEATLTTDLATETGRIDNIISNTDAAALDSLTEIVAAFQAADSNFSALISSNTTAIATEATARGNADTTLQANITAEAGTRAAADTTLQGNITAEATARISGDAATLASAATDATTKADAAQAAAIAHADTEDALLIGDATVDGTSGNTVKARIDSGDAAVTTAFGNADTAITTAFTAADTAIQLQVTANDGDIATNTSDIATNTAAIAQEVTDRTSADTTLQSNIDAEAVTARAAELVNANAISAEAVTARAAELANSTAISNETTRATGIEAGLRTDVDANTVTGSTNASNITIEQTARANADSTLQANIDTETARVDAILNNADGALDTLKEIGDAFAAADSTLQGLITANGTRLTTAEGNITTLDTEMDAAEARLDSLEAVVATGGQSLDTTATTLVGAINEVHGEVNTNTTNIGVIGDLDTTASNLVGAVNEVHGEVDANKTAADTDRAAIRSEFAAADGVVTAAYIAADTAVTGAFQAADAAQTTALQAYADTAEADAITAAGTYTDAEVLTEKTRAEAAELVLTNGLAAEATTARAAEQANAAAAAANLLEITATQASGGLNLDGTYTAHSGSNYIDAGSNLKAVDLLLDAQAKANADAIAGEITDRTTAVAAEAATARAAEQANASAITAETNRATGVEGTLSGLITTNATAISTESARAQAAEGVNATAIANIISNTDAAALDSLTEIVAAFEGADSTLTGLVSANTTAHQTNATGLATEIVDRAAADTALDTAYKAADTTLQSNIDLKLALAGGTMSGVIAMGSNKITGLASGTDSGDAINKGQLDAAVSALDLSNFDTNDLAEGTGPSANLYHTTARARAAISVTDTAGNGLVTYDNTTGVISVNTNESVLDLTDVSDTDYTGKEDFVLRVNAAEDGMELVSPLDIFAHNWRQTIPGDGSATQFALTNPVDQSDALVFVGGVIQDPVTHYSIANQVITMTSAMPVGTAAVVVAPSVGLVPVLSAGQVTTDKLSADIKAYVQGSNVATTTGGDVIDTFAKATYRSAKYIIQADDGNGNYETREALVTHDGTTAYITEYAMVYTGANLVGDASVNMNGNNVELTYTTNSGTATVKVISTYIDV
jgi:hypothetical protein